MTTSRFPIKAMTVFATQGARPVQEDHVLSSQERGIFVVADGFGGGLPGSAASKAACEAVRDFLEREAGDLDATLPFVLRSYFSLAGNVLFNALIYANRKVLHANKGRNVHEKGGASVLAAFLDGDLLALANVGACSAWLFRGDRCVELVIPKSYARLADPMGEEAQELLQAPMMAVGMAEDLEPEIVEYRVRPGDWLLLQTDGIGAEARDGLLGVRSKSLAPARAIEEASQALKGCVYQDNAGAALVVF